MGTYAGHCTFSTFSVVACKSEDVPTIERALYASTQVVEAHDLPSLSCPMGTAIVLRTDYTFTNARALQGQHALFEHAWSESNRLADYQVDRLNSFLGVSAWVCGTMAEAEEKVAHVYQMNVR